MTTPRRSLSIQWMDILSCGLIEYKEISAWELGAVWEHRLISPT